MASIFTKNVTLPQLFFKHFASKNQLPGFYICGTLAKNVLNLTQDLDINLVFLLLTVGM